MRALLASLFLLLTVPAIASATDLLGATLDTSGTWIAVTSKATVPTHVNLTSEGDVILAETAFDLAPGERRQVAYTGSGRGWVTAHMAPLVAEGSSGAIELRAWVVYVPTPDRPHDPRPFFVFLLLLAIVSAIALRRHRRVHQ